MNFKGQGTTEYLIILAIIIVIALVVVGVLGGFPSFASGISEGQSKSYWLTTSPLAISDWSITSAGSQFVVENRSTDTILLREITMNGTNLGFPDANVTPGGSYTVPLDVTVQCTSGSNYSYDLTILYNTPDITGKNFVGARPVVGICP